VALTLAASNSKSTAAQVFSPAASNSIRAQQQAIAIALAAQPQGDQCERPSQGKGDSFSSRFD